VFIGIKHEPKTLFSKLWCHVVWGKYPDVSQEPGVSVLKIQPAGSFEMLVKWFQNTRYYIQGTAFFIITSVRTVDLTRLRDFAVS